MDTSPILGFITRGQASERCQRSERTLQRYWSRAIEKRDAKVLEHLKLRLEDGRTLEGPQVNKEMIEDLKRRRQNPTWYVHADWVEQTYGPRSEKNPQKAPDVTRADNLRASGLGRVGGGDKDMLSILHEQLLKRDEEITYLREELGIKNEQIKEANERTRESNVLMHDLQKMLGDWQQQAFRALPAATPLAPEAPEKPKDVAADAARKGQAGSRRTRAAKPVAPATKMNKPQPTPAKPAEKRQPTALETYTPTLHKAFTRLFRR